MTSHFDLILPPSGGGISSSSPSPVTSHARRGLKQQVQGDLSMRVLGESCRSLRAACWGPARLIPHPSVGFGPGKPLSLIILPSPTPHGLPGPQEPGPQTSDLSRYSWCALQKAQILLGFFSFSFRGLPVGEVTQLMLVLVRVNWFARDFSSSGTLLGASLNISPP